MAEDRDELEINKAENGDRITFTLIGNLSTISTPYLQEEIDKLDDKVKFIDFDIAKLEYISDSGFDLLTQLEDTLKARGGALRLLEPNEFISEILDDLGMEDEFEIA